MLRTSPGRQLRLRRGPQVPSIPVCHAKTPGAVPGVAMRVEPPISYASRYLSDKA